MTTEIEFPFGQKSISVLVSVHNDFIKCEQLVSSPFGHGQIVLPPINRNNFTEVVIKCLITEEQRLTILRTNTSGESICHEVVEKFVADNWKDKEAIQIESINCNHFEQQYKYLIKKD